MEDAGRGSRRASSLVTGWCCEHPLNPGWLPWSEWMMELGPVVRDSLAMSTASLTSAVWHRRSIDHPTTRRLKASSTAQQ